MGRDLHHAVRREGRVSQLSWLFRFGRRCRLAAAALPARSDRSEPAHGPALSFKPSILIAVAALSFTAAALAGDIPQPPTSADETAEEGCASIRHALSRLADAERSQAFALNLASAPGSSTAPVEARLATLLDRTRTLRETLNRVHKNAPAHDTRIEQCSNMGSRALDEAEKLTSTVEELLRSREAADNSGAGPVRSGAAPAGSAAPP